MSRQPDVVGEGCPKCFATGKIRGPRQGFRRREVLECPRCGGSGRNTPPPGLRPPDPPPPPPPLRGPTRALLARALREDLPACLVLAAMLLAAVLL